MTTSRSIPRSQGARRIGVFVLGIAIGLMMLGAWQMAKRANVAPSGAPSAAASSPQATSPRQPTPSKPSPETPPAASPTSSPAREIVYATVDGRDLHLDLYLPKDAKGPFPVVLYVHGGGWRAGSRKEAPWQLFNAQGLAVAAVEYRFSNEALFPAQIHDCKAAVRYLRAHAAELSIDPDHIGAFGGSAGGHLVALLGVTADVKELEGTLGNPGVSSRVAAVCDWYGPTDLTRMDEDYETIKSPKEVSSLGRELVKGLVGGELDSKRAELTLASPVTHVSASAAPFLIYHGLKDTLVPYPQSQRFADLLKEKKAEAELVLVPDHGHAPFSNADIAHVLAFFRTRLSPATSPTPTGP